jgi:hypothetical protein
MMRTPRLSHHGGTDGVRAAVTDRIHDPRVLPPAGVDPREYLADVLPQLTGRIRLMDLPALLPSRWSAHRR